MVDARANLGDIVSGLVVLGRRDKGMTRNCEEEAQHPHTQGVDGQMVVVGVGDVCAHLGAGRIVGIDGVLFFDVLDGAGSGELGVGQAILGGEDGRGADLGLLGVGDIVVRRRTGVDIFGLWLVGSHGAGGVTGTAPLGRN